MKISIDYCQSLISIQCNAYRINATAISFQCFVAHTMQCSNAFILENEDIRLWARWREYVYIFHAWKMTDMQRSARCSRKMCKKNAVHNNTKHTKDNSFFSRSSTALYTHSILRCIHSEEEWIDYFVAIQFVFFIRTSVCVASACKCSHIDNDSWLYARPSQRQKCSFHRHFCYCIQIICLCALDMVLLLLPPPSFAAFSSLFFASCVDGGCVCVREFLGFGTKCKRHGTQIHYAAMIVRWWQRWQVFLILLAISRVHTLHTPNWSCCTAAVYSIWGVGTVSHAW